MALDDLVSLAILTTASTPSKPGFGIPLIAAQKVPAAFTARVREFGSLKEMTDFGFAVTDPAYLAASRLKAQSPSVKKWKIGRRALPCTQTITLKCTSATEGDVYTVKINGTTITYTVLASATTTTVATAIELLIEAVTGLSSTSSTHTITVTATAGAGTLFDVESWSTNFELRDTTSDPGIATDLAAIAAADNSWYGLALDSNSPAEVAAAAAWVETNKKIALFNTSDFDCTDSGSTTDVAYVLKAAAYTRSGVLYSRSQLLSYSGLGLMGRQFAAAPNPGNDTWAYKPIAGVTVDNIPAAHRSAILAKNGNVYESVSDVNITQFGTTGSGEYFDTTRFVDWLRAEIQFRVFSALQRSAKIPYTDEGIDLITAEIDGALDLGVARGGLVKGTTSVSAPLVADVAAPTRASRLLEDVTFTGRLAGAIHTLDIVGTLTK